MLSISGSKKNRFPLLKIFYPMQRGKKSCRECSSFFYNLCSLQCYFGVGPSMNVNSGSGPDLVHWNVME